MITKEDRFFIYYIILLLFLCITVLEFYFRVLFNDDFQRARTKLKGGKPTQSRVSRTGRGRKREDGTNILDEFEEMERQRNVKDAKEELNNNEEGW